MATLVLTSQRTYQYTTIKLSIRDHGSNGEDILVSNANKWSSVVRAITAQSLKDNVSIQSLVRFAYRDKCEGGGNASAVPHNSIMESEVSGRNALTRQLTVNTTQLFRSPDFTLLTVSLRRNDEIKLLTSIKYAGWKLCHYRKWLTKPAHTTETFGREPPTKQGLGLPSKYVFMRVPFTSSQECVTAIFSHSDKPC